MKIVYSGLLIMLLSFISCSDSGEQGIFNESFTGKYSYTVTISCYCTPDYVGPNDIVLEDGIVTKYNGDNIESNSSNYDLVQSLGLDDLTKRAAEIIDQGPHQESVEYHPLYGFIDNCYFDVSEQIADEEWGYTITEFRVL